MGNKPILALVAALVAALAAALPAAPARAQNYPVTGEQRTTAQRVAQAGVPLSELAASAPDRYTVKHGDTLWDISGLYLLRPWRWPELWGMNLQEIRNPHLIYPGQVLVLEKRDGRATLRLQAGEAAPPATVKLSPRVRNEPLPDGALPTLKTSLIEPFLAEPLVVDVDTLARAPRIVAAADARVLLTRGDRAYVRGPAAAPVTDSGEGPLPAFRVFRETRAVLDPFTKAVLGYEAMYVGRATLVRGEAVQTTTTTAGSEGNSVPVPATVDIVAAREEMRVGDRLLPEPPRQLVSYAPRAPEVRIEGGAVASMYGNAVGMAGQNQVVAINKGAADGLASGHVLAILRSGGQITDRSQPGLRETVQLPDERNGLLMVFRVFDKVSYGLILDTQQGVRIGDRVVNPR